MTALSAISQVSYRSFYVYSLHLVQFITKSQHSNARKRYRWSESYQTYISPPIGLNNNLAVHTLKSQITKRYASTPFAEYHSWELVQAYEVLHNLYKKKPQRTTGLDLYSTTLWHLKKQVELSFLAQKATDLTKLSPEAWCAAGNCFSLHGEHDIALSFFQRVRQFCQFISWKWSSSRPL